MTTFSQREPILVYVKAKNDSIQKKGNRQSEMNKLLLIDAASSAI
jgi:hypothetical protein